MDKGDKVKKLLKRNSLGLTITDLVSKSRLSRSTIRNALAKLEGANSVSIRKIGMAKIYTLSGHKNLRTGTLKRGKK